MPLLIAAWYRYFVVAGILQWHLHTYKNLCSRPGCDFIDLYVQWMMIVSITCDWLIDWLICRPWLSESRASDNEQEEARCHSDNHTLAVNR